MEEGAEAPSEVDKLSVDPPQLRPQWRRAQKRPRSRDGFPSIMLIMEPQWRRAQKRPRRSATRATIGTAPGAAMEEGAEAPSEYQPGFVGEPVV